MIGGAGVEVPLMLWRLLESHCLEVGGESVLIPADVVGWCVEAGRWNPPLSLRPS